MNSDTMNTDCKTVAPEVQNVQLDAIEWQDKRTQMRAEVDGEQINNLKSALEEKAQLPPVDLFIELSADGATRYFIGDGWHRFYAAKELGLKTIPAIVHDGGKTAAIKCALGANATHGLRRTNKDKRKAVLVAVEEFPKLSNRAIADICRVSPGFVDKIRPQLPTVGSSRVGKDGKTRRLPSNPNQMDFWDVFRRDCSTFIGQAQEKLKDKDRWEHFQKEPERAADELDAYAQALDQQAKEVADAARQIRLGIAKTRKEEGGK